jgi:hypothetical protein
MTEYILISKRLTFLFFKSGAGTVFSRDLILSPQGDWTSGREDEILLSEI